MAGVEERYKLLLDDPDISHVEAHRVFCSRCEKWLKLDEVKLYAASVWRCHKNTKSHNAKLLNLSASAPPPTKDVDSGGPVDLNSSASGSVPSNSKVKRDASSTAASTRRRSSADDAKPHSVEKNPAGVQQTLPRLKLKVPPPARTDSVLSSTPLPGAVSTESNSSASVTVPAVFDKSSSSLTNARLSDATPQALAISQPASSKSDTSPMQPPAAPSPARKSTGRPIAQSAHSGPTTRSTVLSQVSVSGSSKPQSLSESKSVSRNERNTSSTSDSPLKHVSDLFQEASHPSETSEIFPGRLFSYKALLAEPLIESLEPYRAFCSVCQRWVALSSRTPYSYGIWKGHVRKSEKHIGLQTSQADNERDAASDHAQDDSKLPSTSGNMDVAEHSASANGANDCPPPSRLGMRVKSEDGADHGSSIQEGNERVSNRTEVSSDSLSPPPPIASSSGAQHVSAGSGGSPPPDPENPFALKATTEDSFGPRHTTETRNHEGSQASDEDITIPKKSLTPSVAPVRKYKKSRALPVGTDISEPPKVTEVKGKQPASAQVKLTPAKALQKRRDAMLADPEAAIVESRRVLCRMCERWIKGSTTQEYSSHHWLKHRNTCARSQKRENDRWSETADTRKERLEADPDLDILEAHRALCKLCRKWVKLCSRSRYSASHWTQHKKKCPATQGGDSSNAQTERGESSDAPAAHSSETQKVVRNVEERRAAFLEDPDVLQVLPDRVHCKACNRWIKLSKSLKYHNVNWLLHKECCSGSSVDATAKEQSTLEARKKALEEDRRVAEIEPNRVRCGMCNCWIELRHDCPYSLGKWLLHRRRCGQQEREGSRAESPHSGDAAIASKPEGSCEDDDDDAREAMDVENWLTDEPDLENGGGLPQNSEAGPSGGSGRVDHGRSEEVIEPVEEDCSDQDVEMGGAVDQPNRHLDADDDGKGKAKGVHRNQTRAPARRTVNANIWRKPNPRLRDADGSRGAVDHHHPMPSSGRRRGRGKAPLRPIRPLPKGKGKAAAFMRGQAAMTLPPIPSRPRWPDEDERKQQFVSDPDVVRVEPHRLLCKNCNCWIRLHPVIRYSQSVWPRHKESCKETLGFVPSDAKSRARTEKEDARQRLLEDDPYVTDVSPHRVTCKACGTNIRLDTTYKYEGSHWRAHRSRCTQIPFNERLAKKRKTTEQVQEPVAVAESSDSDDSDASSAPRPRPTSFFTSPLIIKPTEMFKRRSHALTPSPSKVAAAAASKAQIEAELAAELKKVAAELETQGRFTIVLQSYGDGVTTEERIAHTGVDEQSDADGMDVSEDEDAPGALQQSPSLDSESWIPRKRTREEDEAFDTFFSQQPMPPTPLRPKSKMRTCKLGKDAMQVVD